MDITKITLLVVLLVVARPGAAGSIAYADQAAFESALTGGFTLINLDAPPFGDLMVQYNVEDVDAAQVFAAAGLDFRLYDAAVVGGQASQIVLPDRDRLITHGNGFSGEIVIDLLVPANGFGLWSNVGDGGRVLAYSGPAMSGVLLGEANIGSGEFGGVIVNDLIGSVHISCEFNFDLRCGALDLQFGTVIADADGDGLPDNVDNCTIAPNPGQADTDNDGIGNACDADIAPQPVNDCQINFNDLFALKLAFFSTATDANWNADADFNSDGTVNFGDALIMQNAFFGSPGPSGVANNCSV